jgi:hypothetical protein
MNVPKRRMTASFALVVLGSMAVLPSTIATEPAPGEPSSADAATSSYDDLPGDGEHLAPGSYSTEVVAPLSITFTVPEGWYKGNVPFVVWEDSSNSSVGFHAPENLLADPCDPGSGMLDPAVGPTAADLAAALGTLNGLTVSEPVDVMLSDYPGKQVDVRGDPADACAEVSLWDMAGIRVPGPGEGESERFVILDVDGTRLIVSTRLDPEASPDVAQALQSFVDSVRIQTSTP